MSVADISVARARVGSDKRTLAPWYAAEFVQSFSITLFTTAAYFYAQSELGASASERLWLSAGWGALYIGISLLAGYFSEKWGSRRLLVRMSFAFAVAASLGLLVIYWRPLHNLWGLFGVMAAVNFTGSQLWPAFESAVTRSPGGMALSTRVAFYNLTWGSSNFAAFFVAGLFINHWDLIFIVPAVSSFIGGLMVAGLTIPQAEMTAQHEASTGPREGISAVRSRHLLHMAWVGNAMAYVAIQVLIPVLPTLVKIADVSPGVQTSVLISAWTFCRVVGFAVTWRWTAWHYSVRWMVGTFALLLGTFVVMLVLPKCVPLLLAAEVIFGLCSALMYASSLYYAMHVSSGAGGHAGMHEALIGLGVAVGPTVGALAGTGDAVGSISPKITWGVAGLLAVGLATLSIMGVRSGRTTEMEG